MAEVATRTKSNGKPPPEGWERWLGSAAAAKQLRCSIKTLNSLVADGHLCCYDAPDGTKRFNQQSLTDFEDPSLFEDDELDNSDKKASREGIPAEAIRATSELLKASNKQNLELHTLVIQGFKAASEAQQKTIESQQSQLNHYHTLVDQVLAERENMLDARLEREVARENYQAVQKRRTELFEQSKVWANDLVGVLKQRLETLTPGQADPKLNAAIELLKTIDPRQLEVLATMGFFNPTQIGYLERILGRKLSDDPKPEPKAPTAKTSPEPAVPTAVGSGAEPSAATAAAAAPESEQTNA
jgi:hypothetical protein